MQTRCALFGAALAALTPTANADGFSGAIELLQRNQYRAPLGFTPVNNPVTEALVSASYQNCDAFVWGAHNNATGNIYETDIGVGCSLTGENWSARLGYRHDFFPEDGIKGTDSATFSAGYTGLPVHLRANFQQILNGHGQSLKLEASAPIPLRAPKGIDRLTLMPKIEAACLRDKFFGVDACPSNIMYGASVSAGKGPWTVTGYGNYHDGKGPFDNTVEFGGSIGYRF